MIILGVHMCKNGGLLNVNTGSFVRSISEAIAPVMSMCVVESPP